MSKNSLANIQIVTKALVWCLIPFGAFCVVWFLLAINLPDKSSISIFPQESSYFDHASSVILFILLALMIVLPAIVLKREVQKKKNRKA